MGLEKSASLMQAGQIAGVAAQGIKNTWNTAKPILQNSATYKKGVEFGKNRFNTLSGVNQARLTKAWEQTKSMANTGKSMLSNGVNKVGDGVKAFNTGFKSKI